MAKSAVVNSQLAKLTRLAPSGYALELHVRFASALMMYLNIVRRWIESYTNQGAVVSNPLICWAISFPGVIRWNALSFAGPQYVMQHAKAFGLNYGAAISHGPTSSRSTGGIAPADRAFFDGEISLITHLVRVLHLETTPPEQLSAIQVEALRLIANGYRYADAAARLAISEGALKARLRSARERLLCRTTAEAIQRAAENKLF